jgi:regulatory protein
MGRPHTAKTLAVPPVPTPATLHEAALRHLGRYAATAAGLVRVLDRRVDRWARAAGAEAETMRAARIAVREVVGRLVAAGLIDDAAFAAGRAARLKKSGHSRRAMAADLGARGIGAEDVRKALPDDPQAEFGAAVAFARRRRIGPFAAEPAADPRRALGMFARAGFSQEVAQRALLLPAEEAETLLLRLRRE